MMGLRSSLVIGAAALGTVALRRKLRPTAAVPLPHVSETEQQYRAARTRILILGADFGGLATAIGLDQRLRGRDDVSVLVVDRINSQLFTPLLWTVADGRANPNDIVVPIRAFQRGRRFHLLHAEVQRIDLERREVTTTAGARPYDVLVIALGSVTAVPDLPGLRERAFRFHTPADAMQLRNRLIDAVEAAHRTDDPTERATWLTFVVGGGGDTGVELAATIRDYLTSGLLSAYPWLAAAPVRIVLVGRAERLVPMGSPRTSQAVRRVLEQQGVEVRTGETILSVAEDMVRTSKGEIPARTLFWAAGIAAPPVVRVLATEHAANGAVVVDDHLRMPEHPEVFVVGDAAWAFDAVTRTPVPPTAQAAEHEGAYVARVIADRLEGREPPAFHYRPRGRLALLGRRTGVAEIGPMVFSGPPAWLVWHGYYLTHIPSWRNRFHLMADWTLAWLTGRETAQLPLGSTRIPATET